MCTRNQAFEILKIVYHACDPILGHSIHDAILYGSYARGDFTAEDQNDQPNARRPPETEHRVDCRAHRAARRCV